MKKLANKPIHWSISFILCSLMLITLSSCGDENNFEQKEPANAFCGDGILDQGEECDDGNDSNTDDCLNTCQEALCGDGFIQQNEEECDDGNEDNTDNCNTSCELTNQLDTCGDGILDEDEECDDGNDSNTDGCLNTCQEASCGDGFIQQNEEECDDGNLNDGDGCNSDCSLTEVVQMANGNSHTCALLNSGQVKCWGSAGAKLGYGNNITIGDNEKPSSVGFVNVGGKVKQITAGNAHTCALLDNDNIKCWGSNFDGQLGYGNTNDIGDNELPNSVGFVNVGGKVKQVVAGSTHTCALLNTGHVKCWGDAENGRLGYGNLNNIGDSETPYSAGNINIGGTVTQITAGNFHTCALLNSGNVKCWGKGTNGQLGYGNTNDIGDNELPNSVEPIDVGGTVTQITAGNVHTCALLDNGNVKCWGWGDRGQLGYGNKNDIGDNETLDNVGFVNIGGTVSQIEAGGAYTCALLDNGKVKCWGSSFNGQLGYGNTNNIGDDETLDNVGFVNIGGTVSQIEAGEAHTCVLFNNGQAKCWGNGGSGQLGYGNTNYIGDNEIPASVGFVPIW